MVSITSWCEGGGGGVVQKPPSEQPSLQHLAVTVKIKFLGQILVKSTTSQQILFENVHKNIIYILSISFLKLWGGGEFNPVRSTISDQCYFYAKSDKNASTRACFLKISWEAN